MSAQEADEFFLRISAVENDDGLFVTDDINCSSGAILTIALRLIELVEKESACEKCRLHLASAREHLAAVAPRGRREFHPTH